KTGYMGEEGEGSEGLGGGVRYLEVEASSLEAGGGGQPVSRRRPILEGPIQIFREAPVQPGFRDVVIGREERLVPAQAEGQVQHTKRAAEVVIRRHPDSFGANAGRLGSIDAPDVVKVKQRSETRLSEVQDQMEQLIGR